MPVFMLNESLVFPDPREADIEGLLAVGGDLRPERLLAAYEMGIFPWFEEHGPLLWWSPTMRSVVYTNELNISKSMRNILNREVFEIRSDTCFEKVMRNCAAPRKDQDGTWITDDMVTAYSLLHDIGVAHSIEAWQDGELVGGLYGLFMGTIFFGESMFSTESNASKTAFIALCQHMQKLGVPMIDCQIHNPHLESLGAREITRDAFLEHLEKMLAQPSDLGKWDQISQPISQTSNA